MNKCTVDTARVRSTFEKKTCFPAKTCANPHVLDEFTSIF